MKKKREDSWAGLIGGGLAHVQHAVDSAVFWGFRKMRSAGESEESSEAAKRHPALRQAQRAGKGLLSFFGEMGDSFYEKYGNLKGDKK